MPTYTFQCSKCNAAFEVMQCKFDPTGEYANVSCECGSTEKEKLIDLCSISGTDSIKSTFTYRAGSSMERAQGERRAAMEASHMGTDPYNAPGLPNLENIDLNMGEGVHHLSPMPED